MFHIFVVCHCSCVGAFTGQSHWLLARSVCPTPSPKRIECCLDISNEYLSVYRLSMGTRTSDLEQIYPCYDLITFIQIIGMSDTSDPNYERQGLLQANYCFFDYGCLFFYIVFVPWSSILKALFSVNAFVRRLPSIVRWTRQTVLKTILGCFVTPYVRRCGICNPNTFLPAADRFQDVLSHLPSSARPIQLFPSTQPGISIVATSSVLPNRILWSLLTITVVCFEKTCNLLPIPRVPRLRLRRLFL
jgi:hypothetical protein